MTQCTKMQLSFYLHSLRTGVATGTMAPVHLTEVFAADGHRLDYLDPVMDHAVWANCTSAEEDPEIVRHINLDTGTSAYLWSCQRSPCSPRSRKMEARGIVWQRQCNRRAAQEDHPTTLVRWQGHVGGGRGMESPPHIWSRSRCSGAHAASVADPIPNFTWTTHSLSIRAHWHSDPCVGSRRDHLGLLGREGRWVRSYTTNWTRRSGFSIPEHEIRDPLPPIGAAQHRGTTSRGALGFLLGRISWVISAHLMQAPLFFQFFTDAFVVKKNG